MNTKPLRLSQETRDFPEPFADFSKRFFFDLTPPFRWVVSASPSEFQVTPNDAAKLWCNRLRVPGSAGVKSFYHAARDFGRGLGQPGSAGLAQSSDGPQAEFSAARLKTAVEAALTICPDVPCR